MSFESLLNVTVRLLGVSLQSFCITLVLFCSCFVALCGCFVFPHDSLCSCVECLFGPFVPRYSQQIEFPTRNRHFKKRAWPPGLKCHSRFVLKGKQAFFQPPHGSTENGVELF